MKRLAAIIIGGCWGLIVSGPVCAKVAVELVSSSPTVPVGQIVVVDVVVSGLGGGLPPSVGAFDIDMSFDPAILAPTDITFGRFLGDPEQAEALTAASISEGGVSFAAVSVLPAAELVALQPDAERLVS